MAPSINDRPFDFFYPRPTASPAPQANSFERVLNPAGGEAPVEFSYPQKQDEDLALLKKIIIDQSQAAGERMVDTILNPVGPKNVNFSNDPSGDSFQLKEGQSLPGSFRGISRPEDSAFRTAGNLGDRQKQFISMLANRVGANPEELALRLINPRDNDGVDKVRSDLSKTLDKIESDPDSDSEMQKRRINNALWGVPPQYRDEILREFEARTGALGEPSKKAEAVAEEDGSEDGDGLSTLVKLALAGTAAYFGGKKLAKTGIGKSVMGKLGKGAKAVGKAESKADPKIAGLIEDKRGNFTMGGSSTKTAQGSLMEEVAQEIGATKGLPDLRGEFTMGGSSTKSAQDLMMEEVASKIRAIKGLPAPEIKRLPDLRGHFQMGGGSQSGIRDDMMAELARKLEEVAARQKIPAVKGSSDFNPLLDRLLREFAVFKKGGGRADSWGDWAK